MTLRGRTTTSPSGCKTKTCIPRCSRGRTDVGDFLSVLAPYDYAARLALVTSIGAYGCDVMLRAGVFAVPQAGLMALGAYTSGILSTRYAVPVPLAATAGVLVSTTGGALLAIVLGRLDGVRLAIATIAFAEIVRVVLLNIPLTGGGVGLAGIPQVAADWHLLVASASCVLLAWRFAASPAGQVVEAMRVDPVVASHQGMSLFRCRLGVFVAAGLASGVAGVLMAHLNAFLVPDSFAFGTLTTLLAATIVGGIGRSWGPFIGGLIIVGVPEVGGQFQDYRLVFNGVVIVAVIAVAPGGVAGVISQVAARLRGSQPSPPSAERERDGRKRGTAPGPVLDVHALSKFYGGVRALDGVSFEVFSGEMLGLIGPNGSGKTTLLNVLSGLTPPTTGHFIFNDAHSASLAGRPHVLATLGLSRTFQGIRLVPQLDLISNVVIGGYSQRRASLVQQLAGTRATRQENAATLALAHQLVRDVGVEAPRAGEIGGLPYGTLRRIEIARALVCRPRLLLLDEPTAGMTAAETSEVFRLLRRLVADGTSVVVVEHDVAAISQHCDRVAVLNFGKVLAIGASKDVLRSPEVVEAYLGTRARA